jgi:cyclic pyranopterin phosphate synthase
VFDQWGRKINYMRVSVTDRCNFRCVYCMPMDAELLAQSQILTLDEMLRVIELGARHLGIQRIRLTGGEPLVRKGIVDFARRIKEIPGITDLSLSTNGLLLAPMARDLKAAGVDRVNISIDSLDPERFRKATRLGDLQPVLDGIQAALDVGMEPVKLNMVVMKGFNDDEIVSMAQLSLDRPLHVRFIEVMPFSEAHEFSADVLMPAAEIRQRLLEAYPGLTPLRKGVYGAGPAKYWQIPGAQGTVGFISAVTECFCGDCNRVRLSSAGKINPCLGHVHEVDLFDALRSGAPDEVVLDLMKAAIFKKPREHNFDDPNSDYTLRVMHGIGG